MIVPFSATIMAAWCSSIKSNNGGHRPTLGILSLETASTMSRLLCLYYSFTDDQIHRLRKQIMGSRGVTYLNSIDESFLLYLACCERLEDLNQAAVTVSRLCHKCSNFRLNRFGLMYTYLKQGMIDLRKLEFGSKKVQKVINKMEKYVSATSNLYMAWESLVELETAERKAKRCKNNLDFKQSAKMNIDLLQEKITHQKRQIQHYKDISLWSQTFDKSVELMARLICVLYSRICTVFEPYVSGLPLFNSKSCMRSLKHKLLRRHRIETNRCLVDSNPKFHPKKNDVAIEIKYQKSISKSSSIFQISQQKERVHLSNQQNLFLPEHIGFALPIRRAQNSSLIVGEIERKNRVLELASPSTVGGSGLTLRYANVILLAEKCLHPPAIIPDEVRDGFYEMLPARLKEKMKTKLKGLCMRMEDIEEKVGEDQSQLAKGWRDALEEMMRWLGPMAHDTTKWITERNVERKKIMEAKPRMLLLQTLHYSDLEKTEAAIVEVLVGLSCIYWYERPKYLR